MLPDLSYRYKTPLSFSAIALAVALTVSAVLIWRAYGDSKQDLTASAERLSRSLARALVPAMLRDDVWGAYETIMTPLDKRAGSPPSPILLVLDERGRVYVASEPSRFPTATDLAEADPALASLKAQILPSNGDARVVEDSAAARIYIVAPITHEGGRLGAVVLSYASAFFLPRFYGAMQQVLFTTGAILVVLLPIGWYAGRRMARPLVHLTECVDQIGTLPPDAIECRLDFGSDEIGHLGNRFRLMLEQLKEKQALEKEMARTSRLAAVGRIAAGIAHEINNPLGGMLNAIGTLKRHGHPDPFTVKTMSLLERGLIQIKDIVAALLVEARLDSHPLTYHDIEDTRTLVSADIRRKGVRLSWKNKLDTPAPLPSTLVRQILINLLLNAIQAAHDNGRVECRIWCEPARLRIEIGNDGRHIDEKMMEHLFEPFAETHDRGTGLGLWVVHQIVDNLGGSIRAESRPGHTLFSVILPLGGAYAEHLGAKAVSN